MGKWVGSKFFKTYCSLFDIIISHELSAEEIVSYLICVCSFLQLFFPREFSVASIS